MTPSPFSPEEIAAEGIKPDEYAEICARLGRHPNKAELGMFGVMWSEHCCYKNSKPLLGQFPTSGDRVLVGPGENAGVIDLGDGLRLAFKIESHNHPSAIEPYQGAATGVGGILRDIFTMGARPIACLNSLRFGSLDDDPRTCQLFEGVVAGIAGYGNSVGVPTIGGEVTFDPAFAGNPLVNVMALGLMETAEIVKAGAAGIGNPVLYVGSTTGRDGMGGASFASAELSAESIDDRPAVQVGDPFLEKSLIEACLEAFKTGAVVAAQDMGAAGLTCSTSEMAAKGGVGVTLDLDKVPARETGMVPYEYLLSESQERMLLVAAKGRAAELIEIFQRWGLQAVVVGEVIADPVVRVFFKGEVAAEIPATALADNTPVYHRDLLAEPPAYARTCWDWDAAAALPPCDSKGIYLGDGTHLTSWSDVLLRLLDRPTIASKRWVYRQYDHQVQNNTVVFPGQADAAIVRIRPIDGPATNIGVAATTDCNPRYVYLDPEEGAKAAVAEAARNLSCVGADPIAVTDNLNFGSPETPTGYWQLAMACRGIAEACRQLDTPVTGGNVSLYNETRDDRGNPQPIYPTPTIGMVGLIEDLQASCQLGWQTEGDLIYCLGCLDRTTLGGSEYLAALHGLVTGAPPRVDFDLERQVQAACRHGIRQGWVRSAHDCAEGGLAVALAEACLGNGLGAAVTLPDSSTQRWDERLFGEVTACILVSVAPGNRPAWETHLEEALANRWRYLGTVGAVGASLEVTTGTTPLLAVSLADAAARYERALARRLQQAAAIVAGS